MTNLLKAVTFGVMLAASSSLAAYASPLTGTVTIDGGSAAITSTLPLTSGTTSVSFAPFDEYTLGGTQSFAGTAVGVQFPTFVSTFTIPNTAGNVFAGQTLFSFTYNPTSTVETFVVTSVTTGPNGSLYFYGTLAGENATYVLTPGTDNQGEFSGTLTVTPTPEPSSLILLGTGLIGAAGLMFRKRRTVSATV